MDAPQQFDAFDGHVADPGEAAAIREASQALDESQSPLGVDPRVCELRRQLSDLFGVSAHREERQEHPQEETPAPLETAAHDQTVDDVTLTPEAAPEPVSEPANVSHDAADPVRSWLEYVQQREVRAPVGSAPQSPPPPVAPAPAAPPPPPAVPAPLLAPLVRSTVNKSAVREEISSLRDLANRHARGMLAIRATEERARLVWFISGACLIVMCFLGMWAVRYEASQLVRLFGWGILTTAAVSFAVCVNSFQKLSAAADQTQDGDKESAAPAAQQPLAAAGRSDDASELHGSHALPEPMSAEQETQLLSLVDTAKAEPPVRAGS
jgi:hypothetical protein